MTVSLFWRIQTGEFDSWLNPDPDGLAQMMGSQGVQAYSVHRGADDPNSVMVHLEFADRDAVESFESWSGPSSQEWQRDHPGSAHEIALDRRGPARVRPAALLARRRPRPPTGKERT